MTPAELLRTAAANITDETWGQFFYHDGPRSCAVGHLFRVVDALPEIVPVMPVRMRLERELGTPVAAWNDAPERTAADVRALFLRVADELEAAS